MTRTLAAFAVAGAVSLGATRLFAEDFVLEETYGRGVHAYFAGQYTEAEQLFSTAIGQGLQDPRGHYFRGFALTRLGRSHEAESDFREGARLEANGTGRNVGIGRSMQRVQGSTRLKLEQIRREAQVEARLAKASRAPKAEPTKAPPAGTEKVPSATSPPPTDANDPFADGARQPAGGTVRPPAGGNPNDGAPRAGAQPGDESDPFGDQPPGGPATRQPAETPGDPFGDEPGPGEAVMPPAEATPTPPAEGDPFGHRARGPLGGLVRALGRVITNSAKAIKDSIPSLPAVKAA